MTSSGAWSFPFIKGKPTLVLPSGKSYLAQSWFATDHSFIVKVHEPDLNIPAIWKVPLLEGSHNARSSANILHELKTHSYLHRRHVQNVMPVYDIATGSNGTGYLMPYLGDDLSHCAPNIAFAAHIAADLCTVVHGLNEVGVDHRDLKPDAFFLNRGVIKKFAHNALVVSDFGVADSSAVPYKGEPGMLYGCAENMCPEGLDGGPICNGFGAAATLLTLAASKYARPEGTADPARWVAKEYDWGLSQSDRNKYWAFTSTVEDMLGPDPLKRLDLQSAAVRFAACAATLPPLD